jgi:hypothetical protein
VPEDDLAVLPPRLRAVAVQEPNGETAWPPEYVPEVLRVLARAGRTVVMLYLRTAAEDGSVNDDLWSLWEFGDEGTALDKHLAALRRPDVPKHDLVVVAW